MNKIYCYNRQFGKKLNQDREIKERLDAGQTVALMNKFGLWCARCKGSWGLCYGQHEAVPN